MSLVVRARRERCRTAPYAGLELHGGVRRAWVRGQLADGAPIGPLLTPAVTTAVPE